MTTAAAEPATAIDYQVIPIPDLNPSPLNPRSRVRDLDELTASVAAVGILEPLLVRPRPDAPGFEVIAGGRRLAAAKAAGLQVAPCLVRELDDAHALELAIIENNQRGDIHPLDEAEAFKRLAALDQAYTLEAIAAKIGRPLAYVRARLRLLNLAKPAREAFAEDRITLGHAQLLATLAAEQQPAALDACFERIWDYDSEKDDDVETTVSAPLRRLRNHIQYHVQLDPASPETQDEFPELAADLAKVTAAGATVLMLSDGHGPRPTQPHEPLPTNCFTEAKKSTKGAQFGVFVFGRRRGKTCWVTVNPAPTKPSSTATPSSSASRTAAPRSAGETAAARKAREAEQKRQAEAKAKAARQQLVLERAIDELLDTEQEDLASTPALRVIAAVLVGGDAFDRPLLERVAATLKVPARVFDFGGHKERLKLKGATLAQVVAVLAVGAQWSMAGDDEGVDAFDAFGVDVKAIDRAVVKEQAASAKAALTLPKSPIAVSQADLDTWAKLNSCETLSTENGKRPTLRGIVTHDNRRYAVFSSVHKGGHVSEVEACLLVPRAAWKGAVTTKTTGGGHAGLLVDHKGEALVLGGTVGFVLATKAAKKR